MCVIIKSTKKQPISRKELLQAATVNPHGIGVWSEGEVFKTMNSREGIDFAEAKIKQGKTVIFHARISTGGSLSKTNCHPYPCGKDRYLFHNGICGKSSGTKSDTAILASFLKNFTTEDCKVILTFLNNTGKGKFVLCEGRDVVFEVGLIDNRSNRNHIYEPPTPRPIGSRWNDPHESSDIYNRF